MTPKCIVHCHGHYQYTKLNTLTETNIERMEEA